MQQSDLISIAILWGIGLLALIQTINARGAIRLSLSAIATIVIFVIAGFFSYMKISGYSSYISPDLAPRMSLSAITQDASSESKRTETENDGNSKAINSIEAYTTSAEKIADESIALANDILNFSEIQSDASESTRETLESKALSLRNATAKENRQATELFHPRSVSEIHSELIRATENLRLAGYSLHSYTTLDNEDEKAAQAEQYKKQAEIANKAFISYKEKIAKLAEKN
ncbi:MAG: hypothetical protein M0P13_04285 [Fibrobacteraceae bacterium]|nr:hypothetical protein [Fibrobacteraceae bacterium]